MRKNLFTSLTLAFVALTLSGRTLYANERADWSKNDYWEDTNLSFQKLIYGNINRQVCAKNPKVMVGCVAAINIMNRMENPEKRTLIKLSLNGSGTFVEEDLGGIPASEAKNRYQNYLRRLWRDLERSWDALAMMPMNFQGAVAEFEQEYVNAANDSLSAGIVFNEFLKIAMDPHSYVVPKAKIEDRSRSSTPRKGLGVYYKTLDDKGVEAILATEIVPESPADKAGIKKGDLIIEINGHDTIESMVKALQEEDPLRLSVERNKTNAPPRLFEKIVHKGIYSAPNVGAKVLKQAGKNYGYIKLKSFMSQSACEDIFNHGKKMLKDDIQGLVLDLRGNGGGLVSQAKCIMDMFLEPGSKNWGSRRVNSRTIKYTRAESAMPQIFKNLHTATLIDGYSASASEALSMYLKDYRKSFIAGERSFGKGSMQGMYGFRPNRKLLFAKTSGLYYGPKGVSPQTRGVEPDFTVYPSIAQSRQTSFAREEDRYVFPLRDAGYDKEAYIDQERIDQIAEINDCLERESDKRERYESLGPIQKELFDNQLEEAVEILECANSRRIPIYRGTELQNVGKFKEYR